MSRTALNICSVEATPLTDCADHRHRAASRQLTIMQLFFDEYALGQPFCVIGTLRLSDQDIVCESVTQSTIWRFLSRIYKIFTSVS